MKNYKLNIGIASLSLTLLSASFDSFLGEVNPIEQYGWILIANLLIVIPLGYYITNSVNHTTRLYLSTFIIFYIIGYFNILIEAWIFNVSNQAETMQLIITGIPYCLFAALILVYIFTRWQKGNITLNFESRSIARWGGKIIAANFIYFLFYIIAGMVLQLATPRFAEFYGDKIPDFMDIILTNLFFRGFIFVAIAILIDRTIQATPIKKAILIGSIFAILGGIAPLLPKNEFMPVYIRIAHGFEVGISNFLFGVCSFYIIRSHHLKI